MNEHERAHCPNRTILCPNSDCGVTGTEIYIAEHFKTCDKLKTYCTICGLPTLWILPAHCCIAALKSSLKNFKETCDRAGVAYKRKWVPDEPGDLCLIDMTMEPLELPPPPPTELPFAGTSSSNRAGTSGLGPSINPIEPITIDTSPVTLRILAPAIPPPIPNRERVSMHVLAPTPHLVRSHVRGHRHTDARRLQFVDVVARLPPTPPPADNNNNAYAF